MTQESHQSAGVTRRRMLQRMGAGVAVAWTAPIVTSLRVPAYAASPFVPLPPTEAAQAYMDGMLFRFPLATNLGIYSCRHINHDPAKGWSEHSWANAVDLGTPTKAYGDKMFRYAKKNASRFGINALLWQVPYHYGHIHADFLPSHDGEVPPCTGVK
jgi:extensin-like protein